MTEVLIMDGEERLRQALREQDLKYLEEYERGLEDGKAGTDRASKTTQAYDDGYESGGKIRATKGDEPTEIQFEGEPDQNDPEEVKEYTGPPVVVGFHPLGGVALNVRQRDGAQASVRLTLEEVWNIQGHLNALSAMLIQVAYAQAAQQAPPDLFTPPGR